MFQTLSQGGSISSNLERTALRRQGQDPGFIEVLQKKKKYQVVWISKVVFNEKQISQAKKFNAFLCIGKHKNCLLNHSFDVLLTHLGRAFCVFTS